MRLIIIILGLALLSGCVTREGNTYVSVATDDSFDSWDGWYKDLNTKWKEGDE